MKEYKFINLKCRFFSGTYNTNTLEKELNMYAEKGWQIHSMTPDNSAAFGKSKFLIVLLERENHRSINSEIIVYLKKLVQSTRRDPDQLIARAKKIKQKAKGSLSMNEILQGSK